MNAEYFKEQFAEQEVAPTSMKESLYFNVSGGHQTDTDIMSKYLGLSVVKSLISIQKTCAKYVFLLIVLQILYKIVLQFLNKDISSGLSRTFL